MLHDILTNTSWLAHQIDILLWLQNIRHVAGDFWNVIFLHITALGELLVPLLIICIIYWCINESWGRFLFFSFSLCSIFSVLSKMTACVYRPWILNNKILPPHDALVMSGGYSFPSGHTITVTSVFGSLAYLFKRKKIICFSSICIILLVAFSRLYLGVHTPQDVVVAIIFSTFIVFLSAITIQWCEKDKNRYLYFLIVFNGIVLSSLFYILTKQYPINYINGKLLVNPYSAIRTSIIFIGLVFGITNGLLLCKRFFNFEAKHGTKRIRILRGLIGSIILIGLTQILEIYFFTIHQRFRLTLLYTAFIGFFITYIYPILFSNIESKLKLK